MTRIIWVLTALAAVAYLFSLRRALEAANLRGDMYRDIAARLDKRVVELTDGTGNA